MIFIALELVVLITYISVKPLSKRILFYSEIMNELFILCTIYYMLAFTNFNYNINLRYSLGFSLSRLINIIIALNLGFIFYDLYKEINKIRLKYIYDKSWAKYNINYNIMLE